MPRKPLTNGQMQEVVDLVEECLKEGYTPTHMPSAGKGAIQEAAKRAVERGLVATTSSFRSRLFLCRERGFAPDEALYRPNQYQRPKHTKQAPAAPFMQPREDVHVPDGDPLKVLAIGDIHDDPRIPDKSRITALGKLTARLGVDAVVQIGDWGTFDSVSRHEDRSSLSGRALPSFEDDIASLRLSIRAFEDGLDGYLCRQYVTLGNHEDRVRQYENLNAVHEGSMYNRVLEAFADYGWKTRPYGEYLFLEGVGFTHVPLNVMGRPYGGKTLNPIGNDAVFSIVFGHSHKGGVLAVPKIGPNRSIKILNLGCALPDGHVEDYCKMATTGWEYGAYELSLHGGHIESQKHHSMREIMSLAEEEA